MPSILSSLKPYCVIRKAYHKIKSSSLYNDPISLLSSAKSRSKSAFSSTKSAILSNPITLKLSSLLPGEKITKISSPSSTSNKNIEEEKSRFFSKTYSFEDLTSILRKNPSSIMPSTSKFSLCLNKRIKNSNFCLNFDDSTLERLSLLLHKTSSNLKNNNSKEIEEESLEEDLNLYKKVYEDIKISDIFFLTDLSLQHSAEFLPVAFMATSKANHRAVLSRIIIGPLNADFSYSFNNSNNLNNFNKSVGMRVSPFEGLLLSLNYSPNSNSLGTEISQSFCFSNFRTGFGVQFSKEVSTLKNLKDLLNFKNFYNFSSIENFYNFSNSENSSEEMKSLKKIEEVVFAGKVCWESGGVCGLYSPDGKLLGASGRQKIMGLNFKGTVLGGGNNGLSWSAGVEKKMKNSEFRVGVDKDLTSIFNWKNKINEESEVNMELVWGLMNGISRVGVAVEYGNN